MYQREEKENIGKKIIDGAMSQWARKDRVEGTHREEV